MPPTLRIIFRIIGTVITTLLFGVCLLVIGSRLLAHTPYKNFVVLSGSMEPTIHVGSLILSRPQASYQVGEIVTFHKDNQIVTHRLYAQTPTGFITKGDANPVPDDGIRHSSDIIGRVHYIIPYIGYPIEYSKTFHGYLFLILLPGLLVVLLEIRHIGKELERTAKEKASKVATASLVLILATSLVSAPKLTAAYFTASDVNAGNTFTVASFIATHLVINEVDFPLAGQTTACPTPSITETNQNTGAGSTNINKVVVKCVHIIHITSSSTFTNNVNINTNTGGNTSSDSGSINITIGITNTSGSATVPTSQWIELYNPTGKSVSLLGWSLHAADGTIYTIPGTQTIAAQGFLVLTLPNSQSGSGGSFALYNAQLAAVDAISWGNILTPPHYSGTIVAGTSIERQRPGFDTDSGSDFVSRTIPTPGQ